MRSFLTSRKSNRFCALTLCGVSLCLSLLAAAHQARATGTDWKTYISPAIDDYILTASYPQNWEVKESFPSKIIFEVTGLPTDIPGITAKATFDIQWADLHWEEIYSVIPHPFAAPIDIYDVPPDILKALQLGIARSDELSEIIPIEQCGMPDNRGCVDLKRTPVRISGNDGVLIEFARKKIFDVSEETMVDPEGPAEFAAYFTPYSGDVALRFGFSIELESNPENWDDWTNKYNNTALVPIYQELFPTVMRLFESVKFRRPSELGEGVAYNVLYRGEIHVSQRRDYEASASFYIAHPADWEVEEVEATPATASREQGRLIVKFTGPTDLSSTGEREYLLVILEGMSVGPHEPSDFLATTEEHLGFLAWFAEQVSVESVEIPGLHYLASLRSTYITGTMLSSVKTFVGDSDTGAHLKFRIYTAGGQTMVANIIYVADEADFESVLPVIDEMINSLSVSFVSPGTFR